MSAIISKQKLEEMIGMGLINEEMLSLYSVTFFESSRSDNKEMMCNISEQVESELTPVDVERSVVAVETVRQLKAMGLVDETKINTKEITLSKFPSKYGTDQTLVAFVKATETGLDDLLTAPAATQAEMSNDGTLDMDAQADAAAENGGDTF